MTSTAVSAGLTNLVLIDIQDDEAAVATLYRDACHHTIGPLTTRFRTANLWIRFARERTHPSALEAYSTALDLLQTIVTAGKTLDSRHERLLDRTKSLASDAAALAIEQRQLETAVELLEQGRGILLGQLGRYQTPLERLPVGGNQLPDEFMRLSSELETSIASGGRISESKEGPQHLPAVLVDEVGR